MSNNQGLTTGHSHGLHDVKMRISSETLAKVGFLREQLDCKNNVETVARAVKLLYSIFTEMQNGARVELHRTNGEVLELKFK